MGYEKAIVGVLKTGKADYECCPFSKYYYGFLSVVCSYCTVLQVRFTKLFYLHRHIIINCLFQSDDNLLFASRCVRLGDWIIRTSSTPPHFFFSQFNSQNLLPKYSCDDNWTTAILRDNVMLDLFPSQRIIQAPFKTAFRIRHTFDLSFLFCPSNRRSA